MKDLTSFYHSRFKPIRLQGVRPTTPSAYENTLRHWHNCHKGIVMAEIDLDKIAKFIDWRLAQGVRPPTVNRDLRHIKAILRFAAECNDIEEAPKLKMLKMELDAPEAFMPEEFERIIAQAVRVEGEIAGLDAAAWWVSFLLAMYDSGLRVSALLATRTTDVDLSGGTIRARACDQKQRQGQVLTLSNQTCEWIAKVYRSENRNEPLWPWPYSRETLYKNFRLMLASAGVHTHSKTGSLFHRIRKLTASMVFLSGNDPQWQMGHSAASVTRRYLDPRICRTRISEMIPKPMVPTARVLVEPEHAVSPEERKLPPKLPKPRERIPEVSTPIDEPPSRSARGIIGRIRGLFGATPDPEPASTSATT